MSEVKVMECERCGRELPSHHLGCVDIGAPIETETYDGPLKETAFDGEQNVCLADGCQDEPKPYGGRGPRPKFCAAHGSGKGK
jgi:hypothetical protein